MDFDFWDDNLITSNEHEHVGDHADAPIHQAVQLVEPLDINFDRNEIDELGAKSRYLDGKHPEERKHQWRRWCITSNNPAAETIQAIRDMDMAARGIRYFVGQLEVGTEGTVHIQCYVEFAARRRLGYVKSLFGYRIHVAQAKGSRIDNLEYCTKESQLAELFRLIYPLGEWNDDSEPKNLRTFCDEIKTKSIAEVLKDDEYGPVYVRNNRGISEYKNMITGDAKSRDVCVIFVQGSPGAGKTWWAHSFAKRHQLRMHTVAHPPTENGPVWWDGYTDQEVILFDEWDSNLHSMVQMNKLLDIYPLKVPIKGSHVNACWNWVIITTNTPLEEWYADNRNREAFLRRLDNKYMGVMNGSGREQLGMLNERALESFNKRQKFN